jgi:hypothetical protein
MIDGARERLPFISVRVTGLKRIASNPAFIAEELWSSSFWPVIATIFV